MSINKLVIPATLLSAAIYLFSSLPAGTTTVAISRLAIVSKTQPQAIALASARTHTCMTQTSCHTSARTSTERGVDRPQPSIQL